MGEGLFGGQFTSRWSAAQGGVAMTGLLVNGVAVTGHGALPAIESKDR